MAVEDTHTSASAAIVARLLNSPLRGCEFPLPAGRTLFVVGPEPMLDSAATLPELPADTLYVPLAQGGVNFELQAADGRASIRQLGEHAADAYPAELNRALKIGELELALRHPGQAWTEDILLHPQAAAPAAERPDRASRPAWPAALAIVLLAALAGGAYWLWDTPQRQAAQLSALLGRDAQRFQVLPGRDGAFYVAAADDRDAAWARQALLRGGGLARVINPRRENERIDRWLADSRPGLAYYRLQLDDPRRPQLWTSLQRSALSAADTAALSQQLAGQLPYAERVDIVPMDDAAAAREAEAGLTRQALPFSRNKHPDSITFVIEGALDDGELQRARQFVDGYYRQWGSRYVQFATELKDDWLKGKSFKYGDQGYVKMETGHWYFPKPL
ncbi:PrgH/EprH family type III secretion apparatus protein [Chromobacterium subtsugae]|uniref:PrgH/EprH family type III secretion apparatus protein n=1 Tax=Chromobacterium subtsugae TaxID=251747 RepID=UPI000699790D|nr:PrgH/EprH family type III secretion apparatus protein [Chromobacterium subtsugae]